MGSGPDGGGALWDRNSGSVTVTPEPMSAVNEMLHVWLVDDDPMTTRCDPTHGTVIDAVHHRFGTDETEHPIASRAEN